MRSGHIPCWAVGLVASWAFACPAAADDKVQRTPAEIRTAAESLWKEDVAWRQIRWRTCLIDGLNESRREKKPVLLWVFIDRPVDDERC